MIRNCLTIAKTHLSITNWSRMLPCFGLLHYIEEILPIPIIIIAGSDEVVHKLLGGTYLKLFWYVSLVFSFLIYLVLCPVKDISCHSLVSFGTCIRGLERRLLNIINSHNSEHLKRIGVTNFENFDDDVVHCICY